MRLRSPSFSLPARPAGAVFLAGGLLTATLFFSWQQWQNWRAGEGPLAEARARLAQAQDAGQEDAARAARVQDWLADSTSRLALPDDLSPVGKPAVLAHGWLLQTYRWQAEPLHDLTLLATLSTWESQGGRLRQCRIRREAAQLQADCSVDFLRPPTPQAAP